MVSQDNKFNHYLLELVTRFFHVHIESLYSDISNKIYLYKIFYIRQHNQYRNIIENIVALK